MKSNKYTIHEEDGYIKVKHPIHGTVAAGCWNSSTRRIVNVEFTEIRFQKANAIRQPAMDAMAQFEAAKQANG